MRARAPASASTTSGPTSLPTSPTRAFEARCPRCDVTAPIERRQCLHCGGPTVPSTATSSLAARAVEAALRSVATGVDDDPAFGQSTGDAWTKPTLDARGFPTSGPIGDARSAPTSAPTGPIGVSTKDEPGSAGGSAAGASISRLLGGLAWIIGLVALTIVRHCQGQ